MDLPSATTGNYVDALSTRYHYVAAPINSPRHRVRNNLLGTSAFCPTVRRTGKLQKLVASSLGSEAAQLSQKYPAETLARAASFLYTKETRSSFALEGEIPSPDREERFVQALRLVADFDAADKASLLRLQNMIVDPRFAAADYRDFQNFVGETTRQFGEYIHFIAPRPGDVPDLMNGWTAMNRRLLSSDLDPVIAAALCAFDFVFIHPFEDGNGRIHRYLIQYMLNKRGFTDPDVVLPVSATILGKKRLYDDVLDMFSKPALRATEWHFLPDQSIEVLNDTSSLYRFFDATAQAGYLYERVVECVRGDFKDELDFIQLFDAAFKAVRIVVEMPDRRASLITRLIMQDEGKLSQNKRKQFPELTDEEIESMERGVADLLSVETQ